MNKKNDQQDMQIHLSDEHETIMALLDGYATDSLSAQEKTVVAQHLPSCQECQQALRDISHLHAFLELPETVIHTAQLNAENPLLIYRQGISKLADSVLDAITKINQEEITPISNPSVEQPQLNEESPSVIYRRTISELADSVLDAIAQTNREEDTPTSNLPITQQQPSRITRSPSTMKNRKRFPWYLGLIAASMCVFVLVILWFPLGNRTQPTATSEGWVPYQTQTPLIRQGQNVFAVKGASIMDYSYFDFIYIYRSSHPEVPPHVNIISLLSSQPTGNITISSTIQQLGTLGDFEIGEIHAHILNRVGQSIVLQGTFPGQTTPWQLTICYQTGILPSAESPSIGVLGGFFFDQGKLPEITTHRPVYMGGPGKSPYRTSNTQGYTHLIDLVSFSLSPQQKKSTATAPIYLRLDYLWKDATVKATVISQAEYQNLAGPQPTPFAGPKPTPINPDQLRKEYFATKTATAKK